MGRNVVDMPAVSVLIQVPSAVLIFARISGLELGSLFPLASSVLPKAKVLIRRLLRHRHGLTWCYSLDFLGTAGQRQLHVLQRS